jgi:hypothetical protein
MYGPRLTQKGPSLRRRHAASFDIGTRRSSAASACETVYVYSWTK